MPFLEQPVHEIVTRDDRHAGEPRFVDREAVGFVVARVAKDVGDAEPIPDATLGGQQMDPRAEAFERDVLRADDYRVIGLVEVFHGVDQGLDVLLDGDAADVDSHLVLRREAERDLESVVIN
jgi:hypothetical protein